MASYALAALEAWISSAVITSREIGVTGGSDFGPPQAQSKQVTATADDFQWRNMVRSDARCFKSGYRHNLHQCAEMRQVENKKKPGPLSPGFLSYGEISSDRRRLDSSAVRER
jgi:hypothetical protein